MNQSRRILIFSKICLLISVFCILTAFKPHPCSYQGATMKPENRIAFQEGGPHEGVWQTRDLSLDYRYQREANTLRLSARVELETHLKHNFGTLELLKLWVNYLDSGGKILDCKTVLISDYRQMIRTMNFSHDLELPPGAVGMAFSYTGRAVTGGSGDDGAAWDFWDVPRR